MKAEAAPIDLAHLTAEENVANLLEVPGSSGRVAIGTVRYFKTSSVETAVLIVDSGRETGG